MMIRNDVVDDVFEELDHLFIQKGMEKGITHEEAGVIITRLHAHILEAWMNEYIQHLIDPNKEKREKNVGFDI
jgi:hypothetical protein